MMKNHEITLTRGRPPSLCMNCDKVHRHRDDAIFCSIYSFRVTDDTAIPSYCHKFHRRIGMIPKASMVKIIDPPATQTQWGNLYKEQGGVL